MMNDPRGDNQPPGVRPSVWRKLLTRAQGFWRGGGARRASSISVSG
jgi:hypothetical protein